MFNSDVPCAQVQSKALACPDVNDTLSQQVVEAFLGWGHPNATLGVCIIWRLDVCGKVPQWRSSWNRGLEVGQAGAGQGGARKHRLW